MPKTIYKAFTDSMETQYRKSIPYLASQFNSGIKINPVSANDGTGETRLEIQRAIRQHSVLTGVNSRDQDGAVAEAGNAKHAGNAMIDRLNKLSTVNWDSVKVVPGEERIIGISIGPNEELDALGDNTLYAKTINNKTAAMLEEINEIILSELVKGIPKEQIISGLKIDGTSDRNVFIAFQAAKNHITIAEDKYKLYTSVDNLLALVHPQAASALGRYKSEVLQGATELFNTGVSADLNIDGAKGFQEPALNAIQVDASDAQDGSKMEDLLGIMYDIEGLAAADPTANKTDFDDKMAGQRYAGTRWFEVISHFDKNRVVLLTGTKLVSDLSKLFAAGAAVMGN